MSSLMLRSALTVGGVCVALLACDNPSTNGPTEPGLMVPTAPTGADAVNAPTFDGTWRTHPRLLPVRWRTAADLVGNSIVVVGGLGKYGALRRVDAYDIEARTWTALKPLPIPLYDAIGATAIHGKLYVAGGKSANEDCLKTLFVYDPATNSWTRKADMPSTGCHGVQANVLGQLYVYSLYTGMPGQPTLFAAYNPRTDRWVRRPIPTGIYQSYPVGGAINDKFYLTGGIDASGQVAHLLQVYDPVERMWSTKSPMPTGRDGAFAAALHGKLFVAGGVVPQDVWVSTSVVEAYDPVSDTWATGPAMLVPRNFGASAAARGKLFTFDGLMDGAWSSRVEALAPRY